MIHAVLLISKDRIQNLCENLIVRLHSMKKDDEVKEAEYPNLRIPCQEGPTQPHHEPL